MPPEIPTRPELELTPTSPGPAWSSLVIGLLAVSILAAGYLYIAHRFDIWPYQKPVDSQSSWKTYTNSIYGFSLKHPESWHNEECQDTGPGGTYLFVALGDAPDLVICNSDAPLAGIVHVGVSPNTQVSEQELESAVAALEDASRTNITIDGTRATRIEGITKESENLGPGAGKKHIMITAGYGGDGYRFVYIGEPENAKLFDEVVATFKFGTVTTAHTDWKTYRNDRYGFSIQYPATAQFSESVPNSAGEIASFTLIEGGHIILSEGPSTVQNSIHRIYSSLSNPEPISVDDISSERYNYRRNDCNGVLTRIPRPSAVIEITYDDCASSKSPAFPSNEQLRLFNQILDTFALRK